MQKMVSVILLSVLLLGLCGTVFEIRPTSANAHSEIRGRTCVSKSVYSPFRHPAGIGQQWDD